MKGGLHMLANQTNDKGLGRRVVKAVATLARSVAEDSVDNRCWLLIHQPKEPKDMAKRLQAMRDK
jgi:cyclic lactone autoinducer peptide